MATMLPTIRTEYRFQTPECAKLRVMQGPSRGTGHFLADRFHAIRKRAFSVDGISMRITPEKVFKQAISKAGIDRRITPHDLRRTAATRMHFEMNMPLARLQVILGHNSLDQTREYILEDEIKVSGSMSPFDALGLTG